MSKHLSEKNRKRAPVRKKVSGKKKISFSSEMFSLYPDFGLDRECYSADYKMLLSIAAAVMLSGGALLLRTLPAAAVTAVWCAAFLAAGVFVFLNLIFNFRHGRVFCEALPVVMSAVIAFALGKYLSAVVIMLFFTIAKAAEIFLSKRQQAETQRVIDILPRHATILEDGEVRKIKPSHIRQGDVLIVKEKEIIPCDGIVKEGLSTVDLAPLTGEKQQHAVTRSSHVHSGELNISKPIAVEAACDYSASTAHGIYRSFAEIIKKESNAEKKVIKLLNILYPAMLGLFVVTALVIPVFTHNWTGGLKRGMVILLLACPYGLTGAMYLALFSGVINLFSGGVTIKEIDTMEKLANIETLICNKTRTVTESVYKVIEMCPVGISENEFKALAGKVECASQHPIAKAIRKYLDVPKGYTPDGLTANIIPAKGIEAELDGKVIYAGNASLLFDHDIYSPVPGSSGIAIHFAVDGEYVGYFLLENSVRHGTYDALEVMRNCGVKNFALLSSDLRSIVRPVASSLNFNVVKAELDEKGKISAASYLHNNRTPGKYVAFAGDGTEEAAAANETSISIATGTLRFAVDGDKKYDVALLGEGIGALPNGVKAACAVKKIQRIIIIASSAARAVILLFALLDILPAWFAAVILAAAEIVFYGMSSVAFKRF